MEEAPRQGTGASRWRLIRRLGCLAVLAALAGITVVAFLEPHWLHVVRTEVDIAGLPPGFDGLRVVQLTDIHRGPYLGSEQVRAAVELANSLQPDLIVLTGDYCHRSARYIPDCFRELSRLRATLGVYGVLGNHDHWADAALSKSAMARAGIHELTNRHWCLERKGDRLYLAGVGDLWADQQRLDEALKGVPSEATVLLLSHNPDYNEKLRDRRVKLMLAGHTHGGQVALPLLGPLVIPSQYGSKYAAGLIHDGWKQVYVSRGVGVIIPPVRLNCRPEVSLLVLHRQ
jgi:predicted MPP superfamily phosphohydrolase